MQVQVHRSGAETKSAKVLDIIIRWCKYHHIMRRLHESGTKRIVVAIPKIYADGLRKLAVEGRTVSDVVREALAKYFGVSEDCGRFVGSSARRKLVREEHPKAKEETPAGAGVMFPKEKWGGRARCKKLEFHRQ